MKIIPIILLFTITGYSQTFKNYTMDKKYFSCKYPSNWTIEREKAKDEKNKIYKVIFKAPKELTTIIIKYYSPESNKKYKDFIENQSQTSERTLESDTEKYEKPLEIDIKGRKATEINRKMKEFTSIETSESQPYWLKEKIIVVPAKKGFYSITYSAKEEDFNKNLPLFNELLKSLKTLF